MKNVYALIFLSLFLYVGCDKTTDPDDSGGNTAVTKIEGKLPNWTYGTGKEIKYGEWDNSGNFIPITSTTVGSDGSFSLTLPTPSASQLEPIGSSDSSCTSNMTANPSDAKFYGGDQGFSVFSGTTFFGWAFYGKMSVDTMQTLGDAAAVWVYCSKDVTVNGTEVCDEEFNGVWGKETVSINNLVGKMGWNKFFMALTSLTTNAATRTITSTEPAGLSWKFTKW